MTFNVIDILIALIVLLSVVQGYRRGFILSALDLLGWAGSLLAGLRFYKPVAEWLAPRIDVWSEAWDQPAAFLFVVLAARILIQLVGTALVRRLPADVHERRVNQVLGVLPGFVSGLITAAIVAALLLAVPLAEEVRERARASESVNRLAVYAERAESALAPVFDDAVRQTLNRLTVRPESDESVSLPYRVAESRPRPELEAEMLELVNRERVAAGLKPLAPDPELTETARRHSADMFARGYFSHVTPDGRDPFDRIRESNIRFLTAGENLALAPTVRVAHTGLMNSPGHRANILHARFGRVGIGITDGGMRGLMVTQNFRN